MMNTPTIANCHRFMLVSTAAGVLALFGLSCGGAATSSRSDTTAGPTTTGDNVLLNDAINFEGSISGKVVDTRSTRDSTDSSAGQSAPVAFDTASTVVHFNDLAGNRLIDPSGEPIPPVRVDPDGSFLADGLPV
ncbi:MAG: hypothetical protein IIB60_05920, partial [Planctomycetes bacterium]|nr:hypothetical protein [Planctomycetota bacterium]